MLENEKLGPVTILTTYVVEDRERFNALVDQLETAARKGDGFLEFSIVHTEHDSLVHVALRFESMPLCHQFWLSESCRQWHEEIKDVAKEPAPQKYLNGLEHWCDDPRVKTGMQKPPTYKMAVAMFTGIFPLVITIGPLVQKLMLGSDMMLIALVKTVCIVVIMAYVALPLSMRLYSRWLFPQGKSAHSR